MNKNTTLLLFLLSFTFAFAAFGQNEYNDAKDTYNNCINDSDCNKKLIGSTSLNTANPDATKSAIGNIMGGIGGAGLQSKLIYGLTDLIVERAKAELTIKYLNELVIKFETSMPVKINGHEFSYKLSDFMPHIYLFLKDNDKVFSVNIGESFKKAFEADLKEFPEHLITSPFLSAAVADKIDTALLIQYYAIIQSLINGQHPAICFSNLAAAYPLDDTKLSITIQTLKMVSDALILKTNDEHSGYWVSAKEFMTMPKLMRDEFLRLLRERHDDLIAKLKSASGTVIDDTKLFQLIGFALGYMNEMDQLIGKLNADNNTAKTEDQIKNAQLGKIVLYTQYIQQFCQMTLDLDHQVCSVVNGKFCSDAVQTQVELTFQSINLLADAIVNVGKKNYAQSVNDCISLYKIATDDTLPAALIKYIGVAADIVAADSVSQVKNILDGLILPVQSYKVKRTQYFTATINSYPGLTAGIEQLDVVIDKTKKWGGYVAPYLPIGVDFSWSIKRCNEKKRKPVNSSFGFYIPIIDLGAVANYRFSNTGGNDSMTIKELPQPSLRQLFSPGLYFVLGMCNSPVTIGAGAQFSPELRNINAKGEFETKASAIRFGAFLSVDIPLFTVSSSVKKRP